MRRLLSLVFLGLAACATDGLKEGVFAKPDVRYRVKAPDEQGWRAVRFAENDLAWVSTTTSHLLATNATCRGHEDPPLDVLTRHLLVEFTEHERRESAVETLDGREALRTVWAAKLDGVPVELELVVLKKNGCVHDFTLVSPPGQRAFAAGAFARLVKGFAQEPTP